MTTILLIVQMFIVCMLIAVILVQKTGADGLAGLSGGGHNVFSSRASSNLLTKLTTILAIAFMVNSMVIAKVSIMSSKETKSIVDSITVSPADTQAKEQEKTPEVPLAQ